MDLEGYEVFIDPPVLNGVLTGVLLALAVLWLLVLRAALWRSWLQREHGAALELAASRLAMEPRRFTVLPVLALERRTPQGKVQLRLTASFGQPRAVLKAPLKGRVTRVPEPGVTWLAEWAASILGPGEDQA